MKPKLIQRYLKRAGLEALALGEAAYNTFRDKRTPRRVRLFLVAAVLYLLTPIDLYPDLLPGGLLDDLSLLASALLVAGKVGQEHYAKARSQRGLAPKTLEPPVLPTDLQERVEKKRQAMEERATQKGDTHDS